jgi:hypothetical protein
VDRVESRFEKKCVEELRKLPNSFWPDKTPAGPIRGLHDRVGCINGHFISLEFKRSRSAARSALQKHNLNKIRDAGGHTYFVYPENWVEIFEQLKELAHGSK